MNMPHILLHDRECRSICDGVVVEVLYPDHDMTNIDTNDASIVLRIRYKETSFVSGDLPQSLEEHLVAEEGSNLHANVLKLGHHGSRTSRLRSSLLRHTPNSLLFQRV